MNKVLILIFTSFCLIFSYLEAGNRFSFWVFITSCIIQVYSIIGIFSHTKQPYSLEKIFYIFSFFFFGIAPLFQFYNFSVFWGSRILTESDYIFMNILVIIILIIYSFSYYLSSSKKINKHLHRFSERYFIRENSNISINLLLVSLALVSFFAVFYANNFNLVSMLVRSGELRESNLETKALSLIVFRFFQPLSIVCLYYYLFLKSKNYFVLFLLFILTLITCAPTGMARFSAAALYIPLIILLFPIFKKKNYFSLLVVFGLLTIFPFLNQFRNWDTNDNLNLGFDFSMFTSGHFDSYQNFALIVSQDIITYGNQLIGVLFFFVPRSIWQSKPIGSGAFLADELNLYFSNISANFFAEGYINFGFFGIFLFVIILSWFSAQVDKLYWLVIEPQRYNFARVFYLMLLGMLFFMLRGDLMSSFAYTLGFVFSIITVFKMVSKRNFI